MKNNIKKYWQEFKNFSLRKRIGFIASIILGVSLFVATIAVVNYQLGSSSASGVKVFLTPNIVAVNESGEVALGLMIDSGSTSISAVHVEIPFDKSILSLAKEIDVQGPLGQTIKVSSLDEANNQGRVVVAVGLEPDNIDNPPSGQFLLATLWFYPDPNLERAIENIIPENIKIVDSNSIPLESSVLGSSITVGSSRMAAMSETGITKKVLVLNFDPLISGTPLSVSQGWNDTTSLQNQFITDMNTLSAGYLNYQVAQTQTIRSYPIKPGDFEFTNSQYLGCITDPSPSYCLQIIDYEKLIDDYNICGQVNSGVIDEVWLWGGPYFGYSESTMAGPEAFFINGGPITDSTCQRKVAIMGFNYERGIPEMIESMGHRTESSIEWAMENLGQGSDNAWTQYIIYDQQQPGGAECGNVHYPPNGTSDYDYENNNTVNSKCEDWLNYPNLTGAKLPTNCTNWDCTHYGFLKYWFSHIPHALGFTNGVLNNWWAYIVDYDNAISSTPSPTPTSVPTPVPTPTNVPTSTPIPSAFCFEYRDQNGNIYIDSQVIEINKGASLILTPIYKGSTGTQIPSNVYFSHSSVSYESYLDLYNSLGNKAGGFGAGFNQSYPLQFTVVGIERTVIGTANFTTVAYSGGSKICKSVTKVVVK